MENKCFCPLVVLRGVSTPIYIYIYIYIYTNIPQIPSSLSALLLSLFPSHCAGSAHCLARGLIRARLMSLVRLVLDPWRYQVAKGAFSAGPDLGSSSPQHSAVGTDPIWVVIWLPAMNEEKKNPSRCASWRGATSVPCSVPEPLPIGQLGGADRRRAAAL